jgi:hypothetical protein
VSVIAIKCRMAKKGVNIAAGSSSLPEKLLGIDFQNPLRLIYEADAVGA